MKMYDQQFNDIVTKALDSFGDRTPKSLGIFAGAAVAGVRRPQHDGQKRSGAGDRRRAAGRSQLRLRHVRSGI
jgi:hypothetical protein